MKKVKQMIGGRLMKTGIAVFITALVCQLLNWPAMFAVITAVVTIEPTAADSIKKAFVRFPASAIGAGYAVLFGYLFDNQPITYAIVTLLTIFTCTKLRLDAGTLVATLTGIAMIPTVQDHYVSSFFIRLGTTSTGLIVSSLVNIFIMPPNYIGSISAKLDQHFIDTWKVLEKRGHELVQQQPLHKETKRLFRKIEADIQKTEMLFTFQKKEWMFHQTNRAEIHTYHEQYKKFYILKQMVNHLGNLIYLPSASFEFSKDESELLFSTIESLKNEILDSHSQADDDQERLMNQIFSRFWGESNPLKRSQSFTDLTTGKYIVLFEILALYRTTKELMKVKQNARI